MDVAFFPGCIAPLRYPGIESTTREVLTRLGVNIRNLDGASCCPAPGVTRSFDLTTWVTMASRNIALAERMGLDIMTVCNGCFGSLFESDFVRGRLSAFSFFFNVLALARRAGSSPGIGSRRFCRA